MGAKFDKVKAKDGKMRLKQIISVVAADLVPYCLRHTFGTDLQDAGVPRQTHEKKYKYSACAIGAIA